MSTISYRLLAPPLSGSLTPQPGMALRLRALGRHIGPNPPPGRRARPALLSAPRTTGLPDAVPLATRSSTPVPADKPSVATRPADRLHGARPIAPSVGGINPGLIPISPAQTGHHVLAVVQRSDGALANAAAAAPASPLGAGEGVTLGQKQGWVRNLDEVSVYLAAQTGVPQQPGAIADKDKPTALQRDSDRKRKARAAAQDNGFRQLSLMVPDDDDVRSALKALARGLDSHKSWKQAMLTDPVVTNLTAEHALLQRRCDALSADLENSTRDAAESRARAELLASQLHQAQQALNALTLEGGQARTREQAGAVITPTESGATGQPPASGSMTGPARRFLRQGVRQAKGWIMLAARQAARYASRQTRKRNRNAEDVMRCP